MPRYLRNLIERELGRPDELTRARLADEALGELEPLELQGEKIQVLEARTDKALKRIRSNM